jgi:ribosomal protein S18 acetylase RimI-like enzyme
MKNIVISKLEMEDVKEAAKLVASLADYTLDKRPDIFIPNYENWESNLRERIESSDYHMIVAKEDNNIVGTCVAEIKHLGDDEVTKRRDILFIEYIIVKDEYKRLGIGTAMLNHMKEFVKENNISSLELTVWGYNEDAIKFYNKNLKVKRSIYEYMSDEER